MEKRLKGKVELSRGLLKKLETIFEEEGEALGAANARMSRWVSQILPSENTAIPASPKEPFLPPLPPLKTKNPRCSPSSSSLLSSSLL
jgi:hypothetical protein